MTVKELIKKLKKCKDKNAIVYLDYTYCREREVVQVSFSEVYSPDKQKTTKDVYISNYVGDISSSKKSRGNPSVDKYLNITVIK